MLLSPSLGGCHRCRLLSGARIDGAETCERSWRWELGEEAGDEGGKRWEGCKAAAEAFSLTGPSGDNR